MRLTAASGCSRALHHAPPPAHPPQHPAAGVRGRQRRGEDSTHSRMFCSGLSEAFCGLSLSHPFQCDQFPPVSLTITLDREGRSWSVPDWSAVLSPDPGAGEGHVGLGKLRGDLGFCAWLHVVKRCCTTELRDHTPCDWTLSLLSLLSVPAEARGPLRGAPRCGPAHALHCESLSHRRAWPGAARGGSGGPPGRLHGPGCLLARRTASAAL